MPATIRGKNRTFHTPELMRMAYMAGIAATADEIAQELGATTATRVRARLRAAGVPLRRSASRQGLITIPCDRKDELALREAAQSRDFDADELAIFLIRALLAEPIMIDNLISEDALGRRSTSRRAHAAHRRATGPAAGCGEG